MQYKITAAQKKWREECRELGCILTSRNDVEMHHLYGASAKKKYNFQTLWIGQFAQVALSEGMHSKVLTPEFKNSYTNAELFERQCERWMVNYGHDYGWCLPFSDDIYNAIMEY